MSNQSPGVAVTLVTRPDLDTIRAWDHLVSHTPGSDVAQLSAWSAVRGQAGRFVPRYALARRGGRLLGVALVLQRRLPLLGVLGYVPYGSVIGLGAGWDADAVSPTVAVDAVDTISDGEAGLTSRLTGSEVFRTSFGGQPFRYPPAVELCSSRPLRTGYDLSHRSAVGGKAVVARNNVIYNATADGVECRDNTVTGHEIDQHSERGFQESGNTSR